MVPEIWRMTHNFSSFWNIFALLIPSSPLPLTAQKIKISKKRKQYLEISSFNTSVPKIMIIWFTVPEIWWVTDVIVIFHCAIFCSFIPPPLTAQKMKISKQWKKCLEISSFYKFTKNHYHLLHSSWDMTHDTHILPLNSKKKKKEKKKKIEKMKKTPGHIIILKLWLNNVHFLRYGAWQTDRQMVGKSEIDPPKNRNRQF